MPSLSPPSNRSRHQVCQARASHTLPFDIDDDLTPREEVFFIFYFIKSIHSLTWREQAVRLVQLLHTCSAALHCTGQDMYIVQELGPDPRPAKPKHFISLLAMK